MTPDVGQYWPELVGVLLGLLQTHVVRSRGQVPWAASVALLALLFDASGAGLRLAAVWLLWAGAYNAVFDLLPARWRTEPVAMLFTGLLTATVWNGLRVLLPPVPLLEWPLLAVLVLLAWGVLYRAALEQLAELLFAPFYCVTAHGPGVRDLPLRGPVLIVANHSAWFDPAWLGAIVPRPLTPMMTSTFYDLPGLRWLMRYVIGAIRVQAHQLRRTDLPELADAVAALDRQAALVVFPEGRLRRSAEQVLHRFGQGVWHILRQRPTTLVVCCWIEGGWGSYTSYYNGPPTKNKPWQLRRSIRIGMSAPIVLSATALTDHMTTRTVLMNGCLAARAHLGLPAVPPISLPASEAEE
jgi:1-acyl-sn-glycerol-3-phosphate acyltransferase